MQTGNRDCRVACVVNKVTVEVHDMTNPDGVELKDDLWLGGLS